MQNDVAEHVRFGFCLADLTDVDKLLNQRLVFSRQANLLSAHDVGAAIADLDQIEFVVFDGRAGQRGAHAAAATVLKTLVMNILVRLEGGVFEAVNQRRLRIATVFVGLLLEQYVAYCFNGHAAGNVAGQRSAHPIRDDQHQAVIAEVQLAHVVGVFGAVRAAPGASRRQIEQEKIVFVAAPHAAHVGFCVEFNNHLVTR